MLRSHFWQINLEALEEGGTGFFRLVLFGFRSGLELEDVLDGKGEVEEREGGERKAEDNDDSGDAEVKDSRSTNSTNESR